LLFYFSCPATSWRRHRQNNTIFIYRRRDRSKIQLSCPGMALVSPIDSGLLSSFYRFSQGAQARPNNTGKKIRAPPGARRPLSKNRLCLRVTWIPLLYFRDFQALAETQSDFSLRSTVDWFVFILVRRRLQRVTSSNRFRVISLLYSCTIYYCTYESSALIQPYRRIFGFGFDEDEFTRMKMRSPESPPYRHFVPRSRSQSLDLPPAAPGLSQFRPKFPFHQLQQVPSPPGLQVPPPPPGS